MKISTLNVKIHVNYTHTHTYIYMYISFNEKFQQKNKNAHLFIFSHFKLYRHFTCIKFNFRLFVSKSMKNSTFRE